MSYSTPPAAVTKAALPSNIPIIVSRSNADFLPACIRALAPEFDGFAVGPLEDDAPPALFPRLTRIGAVGRRHYLNTGFFHPTYITIEIVRFEAKMKPVHAAGVAMDQLKHCVAEFQISDPEARAGFMFVVMFATKVSFVELDRSVDIGDVESNMIYAFKHIFPPNHYHWRLALNVRGDVSNKDALRYFFEEK